MNKKTKNQEFEDIILLRLNMFLESIYGLLYNTKLINRRELKEEEIQEIYKLFWGSIMLENNN